MLPSLYKLQFHTHALEKHVYVRPDALRAWPAHGQSHLFDICLGHTDASLLHPHFIRSAKHLKIIRAAALMLFGAGPYMVRATCTYKLKFSFLC